MTVRLTALRAGRLLLPGRYLVLTSVRGRVDPRAVLLEGLDKWKKSNDIIGNRTTIAIVSKYGGIYVSLERGTNLQQFVKITIIGSDVSLYANL
jgi:hypothetical protein